MIGRVVSTKMQKSVVVLIERQRVHPLYKKAFLRTKKLLVHDPIGVKMGDLVEFVKSSPFSKRKHFILTKVMGKSLVEITEEKLKEQAKKAVAEVMPEPSSAEASEGKEKKVELDNSTEKSKSKKKGGTELSKK